MRYKVSSKDEIVKYTRDIYKNGYAKGFTTGIPTLDPHYNLRKGELDIIMGLANIGKTTTMFYLMMTASMRYDWRWVCYCPENEPIGDMITDIAEMFIGQTADRDRSDRMSASVFNKAIDWVLDHFTIVTFDVSPTATDVLNAFEEVMSQDHYDGCLLDPVNDLKVENGMSKYDYYYSMLSDVRRFKQKHNVKFIMTTHAGTGAARNKNEDGSVPAPSMYDVEYGGMFANRTDNFIVVHRHTGDPDKWDITELHIRKVKFQKLVGIPTQNDRPVYLKFVPKICRFAYMNMTNGGKWVDPLLGVKIIKPKEQEDLGF